jgi:putative Ca2+/H+ antiporter (TMEM165/GDT1 family)
LFLENLAFLVWTGPVVDLLDVSLPVVVSGKRFSTVLTAKRFHAYKSPALSHMTFLL